MIPHSRASISERDIEAVVACLRSGMINEGTATARLETLFRERYGAISAVATGSGSQALRLALEALGVSADDEVIVPTYVCAELLGVIEAVGATARIVDIAEDYLIDEACAAAAARPRTRAIVVPYVLGMMRDMRALRSLGIPIIEDFAQCIPAAGAVGIGDVAIFSFEATKVIAGGEGGMVIARRDEFAAKLGAAKRFRDSPYKLNLYPLSDLQSTLVHAQMDRLDQMQARRQLLAQRYRRCLASLPLLQLPRYFNSVQALYRFPLRLRTASATSVQALIDGFAALGIAVRRPVDCLLHRLANAEGDFPVAERLYLRTLSLPFYPALSDEDQDAVIAACRTLLADHSAALG